MHVGENVHSSHILLKNKGNMGGNLAYSYRSAQPVVGDYGSQEIQHGNQMNIPKIAHDVNLNSGDLGRLIDSNNPYTNTNIYTNGNTNGNTNANKNYKKIKHLRNNDEIEEVESIIDNIVNNNTDIVNQPHGIATQQDTDHQQYNQTRNTLYPF